MPHFRPLWSVDKIFHDVNKKNQSLNILQVCLLTLSLLPYVHFQNGVNVTPFVWNHGLRLSRSEILLFEWPKTLKNMIYRSLEVFRAFRKVRELIKLALKIVKIWKSIKIFEKMGSFWPTKSVKGLKIVFYSCFFIPKLMFCFNW